MKNCRISRKSIKYEICFHKEKRISISKNNILNIYRGITINSSNLIKWYQNNKRQTMKNTRTIATELYQIRRKDRRKEEKETNNYVPTGTMGKTVPAMPKICYRIVR